jgi:hypothetical protein
MNRSMGRKTDVNRTVRLPLFALLALIALAALLASDGSSHPAGATDFETGALEGTVLWGGSPLDSRLATAACGLQVRAQQGSLLNTTAVTTGGAYQFPALQGGTHDLYLASDKSSQYPSYSETPYVTVATGPSAAVTVGQTTTQDIDLTGSLSLVTGIVTRNGSPASPAGLAPDTAWPPVLRPRIGAACSGAPPPPGVHVGSNATEARRPLPRQCCLGCECRLLTLRQYEGLLLSAGPTRVVLDIFGQARMMGSTLN